MKCISVMSISRCTAFFLLIVTFSLSSIFCVHAEDFSVEMTVGSDVAPPTIPSNVSATPIATTQINLSWNASVDDWQLAGYHVWRDGVRIATTTATTYMDTGLTASTTYTYYVTAYDTVFNESASSTVVATTTLRAASPEEGDTATTQGTRIIPMNDMIASIVVLPTQKSVLMQYQTRTYVKAVVRIGETPSYEIGSFAEYAYEMRHETTISDLKPNTHYYFSIEGEGRGGRRGVMYMGTFKTLPVDDIYPPGNVMAISAYQDNGDINLTWKNPHDVDFHKVRVMRSDVFYPSDVADGYVVYEGDGEDARDKDVATKDGVYYYTIFSYDHTGNISSGGVTRVVVRTREGVPTVVVEEYEPNPEVNPVALEFTDITFMQDGAVLEVSGGNVYIDGSKQLTLSIPYERLPEHLKTILVVMRESSAENARTLSFLLRINSDKTAYTSTIAPFGVDGTYPIQITVFDYKTQQIGYVGGVLISDIEEVVGGIVAPGFDVFIKKVLFGMLLLIVLILTAYLAHKSARDTKTHYAHT
ncbi:MAG TPA: hypothetical protein VFV22_02355 [Candidatus Paceibacterota bacterium]|nr:hypothetical protein [Candidatus Paceibacterota bacterium]